MKFFCEVCQDFQEVEIDDLKTDDLNPGKSPWAEIACKECHFVITTITANIEGTFYDIVVAEHNENSLEKR